MFGLARALQKIFVPVLIGIRMRALPSIFIVANVFYVMLGLLKAPDVAGRMWQWLVIQCLLFKMMLLRLSLLR